MPATRSALATPPGSDRSERDGVRGLRQRQPAPSPPNGPKRADVIIVVVALAIVPTAVEHRLSRFEVIYFLVLIPSIILHEISMVWPPSAFGDDTAKRMGRLNLNPIRHVDPIGTLLVPAVLHYPVWGRTLAKRSRSIPTGSEAPVTNSAGLLGGPSRNICLAGAVRLAFVLATLWTSARSCTRRVLPPPSSNNPVHRRDRQHRTGGLQPDPVPPLDGAALLERFIPARLLPDYYSLQRS